MEHYAPMDLVKVEERKLPQLALGFEIDDSEPFRREQFYDDDLSKDVIVVPVCRTVCDYIRIASDGDRALMEG